MPRMTTDQAIKLAGGREKLADLLGVQLITTFGKGWKPNLPPRHEKFLRLLRPRWFRITQ
jgi:hypothetical protein